MILVAAQKRPRAGGRSTGSVPLDGHGGAFMPNHYHVPSTITNCTLSSSRSVRARHCAAVGWRATRSRSHGFLSRYLEYRHVVMKPPESPAFGSPNVAQPIFHRLGEIRRCRSRWP